MRKQNYKGRKINDVPQKSSPPNILINAILSFTFSLLGVIYALVWACLFLYYIERKTYPQTCKLLIDWDRVLYIIQLISSSLHLISSIIQIIINIKNIESAIPKIIMGCKSCLNCVTGIIFLIGINVVFFQHHQFKECGALHTLTLAYIIVEWSIMGGFMLCIFACCSISIICGKMKKKHFDEGDLSDEEMEI